MQAFATLAILAAALAAAQSTTVKVFMPTAYDNNVSFAASVIGACSDQTLYEIQCTEGIFASTITCDSNGPKFTVTEGQTTFAATTSTSFSSALLTLTETCTLRGSTHASCSLNEVFSSAFKTRQTGYSTILSGPTVADFYYYNVQVTAGAENLAGGGTCSSAGPGSASTLLLGSLIGAFVLTVAVVL